MTDPCLFDVSDCGGPFACDEGCGSDGIKTSIQFLSNATTQDAAGQVRLSYTNTVLVVGELVGTGGKYPRYLGGTIDSFDYEFTVIGNPDVKVGNRCFISGFEAEITAVNRLGTAQAEIEIKHVR